MVITKRGVSPRIVAAKLIGTGGVTRVTGEQLEVALGGYSTWMSFQKVAARSAVRVGLDRDAVVGLAQAELVGGAGIEGELAGGQRRGVRPSARGRRPSS